MSFDAVKAAQACA